MIKQAVYNGFMGTPRDTLKPDLVLSLFCANILIQGALATVLCKLNVT